MGPARIVSLVPSLTDLVFWLGAGGQVVGRTRFCDEPRGEVERVDVVGGTKDPDVQLIVELEPELVIANKEENRREDVEALRRMGVEVLLTDPNRVEEALGMVEELGRRLGCEGRAAELVAETRAAMAEAAGEARRRVFVPIRKRPLMALGGRTYGSDVLACAGAENVFGDRARYPEVSLAEVREAKPDAILLPDEPYRFREADARGYAAIAPARVVDGRLLWWYGPRMPAALRELAAIVRELAGG